MFIFILRTTFSRTVNSVQCGLFSHKTLYFNMIFSAGVHQGPAVGDVNIYYVTKQMINTATSSNTSASLQMACG